jgi:hypothetical protein
MDDQLYFAEIVPNIYWIYHYSSVVFNQTHKDFIGKICQTHGIKELIKIDSNSKFWRRYDNINKEQEYELLRELINNITSKMSFNYNNRIPTLIISISNNDIALASIINYFQINTKMTINLILEALKYKIPNLPDMGAKVSDYLGL